MLVELFITLQVILILVLGLAFFTKNGVIWALAMVIAGALAISSYGIETHDFTLDNTTTATTATAITDVSANTTVTTTTELATNNYTDNTTLRQELGLFALNLGFFLISMVFFFVSIYEQIQNDKD